MMLPSFLREVFCFFLMQVYKKNGRKYVVFTTQKKYLQKIYFYLDFWYDYG